MFLERIDMVEKLSPADNKVVNETVDAKWRRRRLVAFTVTALSLFLLLVFAATWRVKGYRSDNSLAFRLSGGQEQLDTFNSDMLRAWQETTADESLIQIVGELEQAGQISSPIILASDLDTLRDRIKVYTRELENNEIAEVRFSFIGNGSEDESRFLKQLTEKIYARFNASDGLANDLAEVDSALSQVSGQLRNQLQNQNSFSESFYANVSQLDQQLIRIRGHLAELGNHVAAPAQRMLDEQTRLSPKNAEPTPVVVPQQSLDEVLEQNRFRHLSSSQELSGVERQIAVMRTKAARVATTDEKQFKDNQYYNDPVFDSVSFPKSNGSTTQPSAMAGQLALLNEEFQQLNTSGLYSVFDSIQTQQNTDLSVPIEFIENFRATLDSRVRTSNAAPMVKPGKAKVSPIGGVPNSAQVFWISLISLAFGAAIAWRLNPADFDRGFSDASDLSETLGLPVVGSFPLESAEIQKIPMATRIVTWCKIGLTITLVVIAICCLLSPSVRSQMIENPIRGLARVAWFFKGR